MATVLTSYTLISTCQTTRCQNPKCHNLNLYGREGFRCDKHVSVCYIGVQVRLLSSLQFRQLFAVFLSRKPGVDIRIVHIGYVLDLGHWDRSVSKNFDFPYSVIYQPILCIHNHSRKNIVNLMTALVNTTQRRNFLARKNV